MKVHHVAICVSDLDISIKFYSDYFGFTAKKYFRKEEFKADFCLIESDGFEIELFKFDSASGNNKGSENLFRKGLRHLAFEVSDIYGVVEKLEKDGLHFSEIKKGKSGNLFAFCTDPDGIELELLEVTSGQ